MTAPGYRLSCDVGGTFTDIAIGTPDGPRIFKSPTRINDPEEGVLEALTLAARELGHRELGPLLAETRMFVHATTLGLNAILERRAARVALLATEGHRDVLLLREGGKSEPFNLRMPYPRPLVPRADTFGVRERIGAGGEVVEPLDRDSAKRALTAIAGRGFEAIAICLLWSVDNPNHELELADLAHDAVPELPVSLSHRVAPIVREYRRASAACIDASLKPIMERYLKRLGDRLRAGGYRGGLYAVTSAGALITFDEACECPVLTVNSGRSVAPVAGRAYFGAERGPARDLLVVDTGGTSFDVSVVHGTEIPQTSELWLGERFTGALLGLPAVDVHSIGSGGGSIAWVDDGGLLRVGPRSAGATPGPAAYGRGGTEPTVTDAAVVAGWIDPERFLDGRLRLDASAARGAIEDGVAARLGVPVDEAAAAVLALSDEQMIGAIEQVTISQGIDPRQTSLVAGGGAGGLSVDRIARRLGCPGVLIPPTAAALSSCGGLLADHAIDLRRSSFTTTRDFDFARVAALIAELTSLGGDLLAEVDAGGRAHPFDWFVSARYSFQVWEIEVPLSAETIDDLAADHRSARERGLEQLRRAFHERHRSLFAVEEPDQSIECIGWRLRVAVQTEERPEATALDGGGAPAPRSIFLDDTWTEVPVFSLAAAYSAGEIGGPAVIETPASTLVIRAGSTLAVTRAGSLWLTPAARTDGAIAAPQRTAPTGVGGTG